MKISVMIEGMAGLTWPRWQRLIEAVEQLGFAGLFRSDHFTLIAPPDLDSLEMVVSLTYAATHSQHIHFGPLVAPFSFRDPIMLARQAMAIDDLSGGRMILGVGAGWQEREHTMFGYNLGDMPTRLARFEEGLEVIAALVRSDEPVDFQGRFYQLRGAHLLPRPQRTTPILIGGNGPKRTLPLVARFADIWNCHGVGPDVFKERSALLDELLRSQGRTPGDVKRTVMHPAICWHDAAGRERRLGQLCGANAPFSGLSYDAVSDILRNALGATLGTPETIIEQMRAFAAAGAEELVIQWWGLDDMEGLEMLAEDVMPYVTA